MADRMKYKIGGVLQETEESVGSMTDMMNFTDTLDALVLGLIAARRITEYKSPRKGRREDRVPRVHIRHERVLEDEGTARGRLFCL